MSYTVTPSKLTISHGEDSRNWKIYRDRSSGSEIAKLVSVCCFGIRARVAAECLRNNTCYSAYLIFKLESDSYGLEKATAAVRFLEEKALGTDDEGYTVFISMPTSDSNGRFPVNRCDGWMELKLGDFINNLGPCATVEIRISETKNHNCKSGITIKGIELRPHQ